VPKFSTLEEEESSGADVEEEEVGANDEEERGRWWGCLPALQQE